MESLLLSGKIFIYNGNLVSWNKIPL